MYSYFQAISDRTRENGLKLHQGQFRLYIRKISTVKGWLRIEQAPKGSGAVPIHGSVQNKWVWYSVICFSWYGGIRSKLDLMILAVFFNFNDPTCNKQMLCGQYMHAHTHVYSEVCLASSSSKNIVPALQFLISFEFALPKSCY